MTTKKTAKQEVSKPKKQSRKKAPGKKDTSLLDSAIRGALTPPLGI